MKGITYTRFSAGLPPVNTPLDVKPIDPAWPDVGTCYMRKHNEDGTITLDCGRHTRDYDASYYEWCLNADLSNYHANGGLL